MRILIASLVLCLAPMAEAQQISRADLEQTLRSAMKRMEQSVAAAQTAQANAKKAEEARAKAVTELTSAKAKERELVMTLADVELKAKAMEEWGIGEQSRADAAEGREEKLKDTVSKLGDTIAERDRELETAQKQVAGLRRAGSILVASVFGVVGVLLTQFLPAGWWRLLTPPAAAFAGYFVGQFIL